MTDQIQNFDEFIAWLEQDGLSAKKSKRLWRKKIFTNLVNNESKTIENYEDFLLHKKLKNIVGKSINYQDIVAIICDYKITMQYYVFTTYISKYVIKVKIDSLDDFIEKCIDSTMSQHEY